MACQAIHLKKHKPGGLEGKIAKLREARLLPKAIPKDGYSHKNKGRGREWIILVKLLRPWNLNGYYIGLLSEMNS